MSFEIPGYNALMAHALANPQPPMARPVNSLLVDALMSTSPTTLPSNALLDDPVVARALRAARPKTERRKPTAFEKWWAWQVCERIPGLDPGVWRRDVDGNHLRWSDYGGLSAFAWEVDHVWPLSLGGPDVFTNMRARHFSGNRSAGAHLAKV